MPTKIVGIAVLVAILGANTSFAILLCEGTLNPPHKVLSEKKRARASEIAFEAGATEETIDIPAADGVKLVAWFFGAKDSKRDAVILLHGSGDNRGGPLGFVPMFLRHHYDVLVPD